MSIAAIAILWVAYAEGFYGYCLIRGINVSFWQVVSPTSYLKGKLPAAGSASDTQIFPSGTSTASVSTTATLTSIENGGTAATSGQTLA